MQRIVNGVVVWRAWLAWIGADGWLGTVLGVLVLPGIRDLPTDRRYATLCCVLTPVSLAGLVSGSFQEWRREGQFFV